MKQFVFFLFISFFIHAIPAQRTNYVSKVWVADNGNGTYKNPIIHADYSDPDAIRVGDDYYMIASSFDAVPCLPILHSKDLVNWSIIGHALDLQIPVSHFSSVQHGNGVWAPAIRYHNKEFYIYYPDPDYGIYLTKAASITGSWSTPILVQAGKGLIDPCPLWDDDGNVYLVHAFAGSRAGIKSVIIVKKLNDAADKVIDSGVIVYDGHKTDSTVEGPKFYKRNGYYYIFAPAGGVKTGWQLVLRSKSIYGPYERKIVMGQGNTNINGPHQGAWVQTQTGEDWFIHFQDKGAYGRVVHLQPMHWKNDWPVIGAFKEGDDKGEPVSVYKKPDIGKIYPVETPQESDEFNSTEMGLQWQWQANPKANWASLSEHKGSLRLFAVSIDDSIKNDWSVPNLLLQKFPAPEFTVTTKINFNLSSINEKAGLIILGSDYASLSVLKKENGLYICYNTCVQADKDSSEAQQIIAKLSSPLVYLRTHITAGAVCLFSYSEDGVIYKSINQTFMAMPGKWVGAKIGLFCTATTSVKVKGYADVDWFRIE